MKHIIAVALIVVTSYGCTSAGPFVTGISSDGQGNLIIEKAHVKHNSFTGTISNENSTTTVIRLAKPE